MSDSHYHFMLSNEESTSWAPAVDRVNHTGIFVQEFNDLSLLTKQIDELCMSNECSDVVLIVEEQKIPAHRVVLASRSTYFRAMFFSGMRETRNTEIVLHDTSLAAFKVVLKYIYSGRVRFTNLKLDQLLDVFNLVHKYDFRKLEDALCEYLKASLQAPTVALVYATANLFSREDLADCCLDFMDKCAAEVLKSDSFQQLDSASLEKLISRDSFCAPEIMIFDVVAKWIDLHQDEANYFDSILQHVRLPLIKIEDLMNVVRPTGLIQSDRLLDTIADQTVRNSSDIVFRGFRQLDTNVATVGFGAQVVEGDMKESLLRPEEDGICMRDSDRCTQHEITDSEKGIIVKLGRPYILNYIELCLNERDQRCYYYHVDISMDRNSWCRVVDYSKYMCCGRQQIYFPPRVAQYIRVVGTGVSVGKNFILSSLKTMYSTKTVNIDPETNFIVPTTNVTTVDNNAHVVEGVSRSRNALLNGEIENYDWDNGYTCHQLGSGSITVQLPQPYIVGSMRLLLWDCDDRLYSFYVEVSHDQQMWTKIIDACNLRSWQTLYFKPLPVVFIRITGTQNTANEVFHCVHFECPADPSNQRFEVNQSHADDIDTYPVRYGVANVPEQDPIPGK